MDDILQLQDAESFDVRERVGESEGEVAVEPRAASEVKRGDIGREE